MKEARVILPAWACVSEKRLAHIQRVTALLDTWSARLKLPRDEALFLPGVNCEPHRCRARTALCLYHPAGIGLFQ